MIKMAGGDMHTILCVTDSFYGPGGPDLQKIVVNIVMVYKKSCTFYCNAHQCIFCLGFV